ncbi:MAG: M23 family metallopeptidase [Anaerolineales bacterium]|nr:M23 family metallopeptidase [Anaerolineales bacterium]
MDESLNQDSPQEQLEPQPEEKLPSGPGVRPQRRWLLLFFQVLINLLVVVLVGVVGLLAWDRLVHGNTELNIGRSAVEPTLTPPPNAAPEASESAPAALMAVSLPAYNGQLTYGQAGIQRAVMLDTLIPTRERVDVITYTVQSGDSLFSIADSFGLKPETILWGNFATLQDNPHLLRPNQDLYILPVNGTYYQWSETDTLSQVADFFEVEPQTILEYPGNRFDLTTASVDSPGVEPGSWLIVPGGIRETTDWGPPTITRSNPASARYYGAGHCGAVYTGAVGTGSFIWPTTSRQISGYNYDPVVHPAIDIGGSIGNAIYATDSGVVVYAGWSDYGYGYLIVIDHGNGWQSAYAHLSAVGVGCGQSVFQGSVIGGLGSTGNSTGPHLHFELVYNGAKLNPLNFVY